MEMGEGGIVYKGRITAWSRKGTHPPTPRLLIVVCPPPQSPKVVEKAPAPLSRVCVSETKHLSGFVTVVYVTPARSPVF